MNQIQTIWEENDLIEPLTKFENKPIFVPNNGINETKNVSVKNECKNTGNKKKWKRKCPRCNREIFYSSKYKFEQALNRNNDCISCITTLNNRTKENYIGKRYGKITIVNQYYKDRGNLKVDYLCDCGNVVFEKSFSKVKIQQMCAMCRKTNAHKINKDTSFNMVFREYMRSAKLRHLEFGLTRDQVFNITHQDCFYCGSPPTNIMRKYTNERSYIYNGIDRKDSNDGYVLENVVPCCKRCNNAKWDLPIEEFLNHVKKIYNFNFVERK